VLVLNDDVALVYLDPELDPLAGISALRSFQLYLKSRKTMFRGLIECDPGVRVPNRANSATFEALSYAFAAATFQLS
jgi:hypothetical protein